MWRTFKLNADTCQLYQEHTRLEQLTSSEAQSSQVGGDLAWHASTTRLAKLSEVDKTLEIDNTVLKPSTVVRNLGVLLLDEQLSMDANARQCAKTCFFHLRRIRQLRRHVDYETLYMLVRALVLSRLDYCNRLFSSSSKSTIKRLQRVQDAAARLLWNAPPRSHA